MTKVDLWDKGKSVGFDCPGCGHSHVLRIRTPEAPHPSWEWNGSLDKPTLHPSILVTWTWKGERQICHSFVIDGRIQFLADCTHTSAGRTVELSEVAPQ